MVQGKTVVATLAKELAHLLLQTLACQGQKCTRLIRFLLLMEATQFVWSILPWSILPWTFIQSGIHKYALVTAHSSILQMAWASMHMQEVVIRAKSLSLFFFTIFNYLSRLQIYVIIEKYISNIFNCKKNIHNVKIVTMLKLCQQNIFNRKHCSAKMFFKDFVTFL